MDKDEREEHIVDVWLRVRWATGGGRPGFGGYACRYCRLEGVDDRFDVGLEEASVDLREDVADCFALVCEFDREGGFELRD